MKKGRPRKYEDKWKGIERMLKNGFKYSKIAYWQGIPRTSIYNQIKLGKLSTFGHIDQKLPKE